MLNHEKRKERSKLKVNFLHSDEQLCQRLSLSLSLFFIPLFCSFSLFYFYFKSHLSLSPLLFSFLSVSFSHILLFQFPTPLSPTSFYLSLYSIHLSPSFSLSPSLPLFLSTTLSFSITFSLSLSVSCNFLY